MVGSACSWVLCRPSAKTHLPSRCVRADTMGAQGKRSLLPLTRQALLHTDRAVEIDIVDITREIV